MSSPKRKRPTVWSRLDKRKPEVQNIVEIDDWNSSPKPYVFVLMPFHEKFNDIYNFGIKGAAEEAGAYAERADEQFFQESILDRVLNQINKADVIVADMTDRNPNVFYEVGYAHALNKVVLLLTQDFEDIPFDLKHRQHIVYEGSIQELRQQLVPSISWAIEESRRRELIEHSQSFSLEIDAGHGFKSIPKIHESGDYPTIEITNERFIKIKITNTTNEGLSHFSHAYLFMDSNKYLKPFARYLRYDDPITVFYEGKYLLLYHVNFNVNFIPKGESEFIDMGFVQPQKKQMGFTINTEKNIPTGKTFMILRLHIGNHINEFAFWGNT